VVQLRCLLATTQDVIWFEAGSIPVLAVSSYHCTLSSIHAFQSRSMFVIQMDGCRFTTFAVFVGR
jgi:hypothetical protein